MRNKIIYIITGLMWVCYTIPALGQSITGAEYFFDSDPGLAMGTPITVTTGDQVDVTADISTTGLNPGFHSLIVRTKNSNGKWSLYESRNFYIQPASISSTFQLKQAEYFFDDDPGVGNGTPVTAFTQADQISITQIISLSGLNPGFHTLMIRVKSDDKHWSLYESRNIYIKPPVTSVTYKVAKAEYFFDTDPGLGKGTPCDAFTKDSAVSLSQNIDVSSLSAGFHNLIVRVFGDNGQGSMYESRNIYVKPGADQSDNIKLTYAEYFFDTDPGNGSATAFPAFTPADSIDQTQTPSIASLTAGSHTLNIRVRNSLGLYSITESRSFDICSAFPTANFTYDEVCTGTPTTFTNATTGSDNSTMYKWDIKADGTIESTNKDTTKYNLTTETDVKLIAYNSDKCSDTVVIAVPVKPTPYMPSITKYGADSLSASLSGVTYNWYLNGTTLDLHTKNIKPATAGNYTVEAVLNGCISAISGSYNFVGTGIGNLTLDGYKIYPNPSNGSFTVEFGYSGADDINVSIVNQNGAVLYSTVLKSQPFIKWDANLPGIFRAGVYYIKFTSNSKVLVQKMVVY